MRYHSTIRAVEPEGIDRWDRSLHAGPGDALRGAFDAPPGEGPIDIPADILRHVVSRVGMARHAGTIVDEPNSPIPVIVHTDRRETATNPYVSNGHLHIFRRPHPMFVDSYRTRIEAPVRTREAATLVVIDVSFPSLSTFEGGRTYGMIQPAGQTFWYIVKPSHPAVKRWQADRDRGAA